MSNMLDIPKDEITKLTEFKEDLGLDSLDLVELIMELEEEFDITIEDEDASKFTTVNDALSHINDLLNNN
ncbi:acyl carrier protein [Virgibacillus pantothenticus]|nr:acyl carrier protein [Virgibacillus pantothenticus]MBU8600083.1 acyl carrier protein [Virgibacillus pantothenticus]MBU8633985.1 acyl carrier protein [Virgibacillus pantothenticus]MBU8641978.1 acyl carrier protein [Virgibacillus pantothenticus]MBU8645762.1 acyl carrier protein [Virgibacillus pantothenticus]